MFSTVEDAFSIHPDYIKMKENMQLIRKHDLSNPYFTAAEGIASDTVSIANRLFINYSSYNYLNLNGHPEISAAAKAAIDDYGTSVSASRVVGGERPLLTELERVIADLLGVDDCVSFVSGHATNVSTIGYLMSSPESNLFISNRNLILYDDLSHNSIVQGAKLAGADMCRFRHNDVRQLEKLLRKNRKKYQKVLIVIEGLYSMDGDIPPLREIVRIKEQYDALLMVDEAHSVGVLGQTGAGIVQHLGLEPGAIDIYMGTLSKSLASCGGYIAGRRSLVDLLRHHAPGFVFSVGIAPPLAAAAIQAIKLMQNEPERLQALHDNCRYFVEQAQSAGLNTGHSQGYCIVPVIIPNPLQAVEITNRLFERNIYVQPMIYPAVKQSQSRLRFFISCAHSQAQIDQTVSCLAQLIG